MVNDIDVTLAALADPTRREVVELLRESPRRAGELAAAAAMSGPAMSRHLRVLRTTGLIEAERAERDARVRVYRLRPEPFVALQAWLDRAEAFWTDQLTAFKEYAEQTERSIAMSPADLVVTASVDVAVDPTTAFRIFTQEIDRWWRPGPHNWNDRFRAVGIRIEPGIGGRWIEVYDPVTGDGFECGRIVEWEPGVRFAFLYRDCGHDIDDTRVEIRFEAADGGTRVTLEHQGWERVAPEIRDLKIERKTSGWGHILSWYADWASWGSPLRIGRAMASGDSAPSERVETSDASGAEKAESR